MSQQLTEPPAAAGRMLLGDEAVALAAIDAGISSAYAYPGTPSTEIFQYLLDHAKNDELIHANWSANEKTSVEQALGASMMNRRSIVTMKHVGLNVAADPFMNAAIVAIQGGLVIAVADDPGMHSSQNEQDSRYFADFARVICLEPSTQQECYDMTREAFDLSERFQIPVVIRLVTRLCHSRAAVQVGERRPPNPFKKAADPGSWILLPANARRLWRQHLDKLEEFGAWSEQCQWNALTPSDDNRGLGVITTGLAHNYYLENLSELDYRPAHLHIGAYPFPEDKVRELASQVDRLLIIEEGYPFVERFIRGVLSTPVEILGKESGELPLDGELNPDNVRAALGLPVREAVTVPGMTLPGRPPQLCQGCPHRDSYQAIRGALEPFECSGVMSDIGCYTLGALPPFQTIESCVCMGASIGMAKGAADAGLHPVLAVIGDSTFLHSGVTPLMDAIAENTNMTVMILDNEAVAMTGAQPTLLPESRLEGVVRGLGIDPEHFHHVEAHPKKVGELTELIHREAAYQGLSVILVVRRCIVAIARDKKVEAKS